MPEYSPNINIRNASSDDVQFVSECVLAAVDLYDFHSPSAMSQAVEKICGMDDTLYSYKNARIACVDGTPVGCLISYDGNIYSEARVKTFQLIITEGHSIPDSEMETGSGEWYLDSMAILPAFRGYGIGKLLMQDAIRIAKKKGLHRASLIVDRTKPALQAYYATLGFAPEKDLQVFGSSYVKMIVNI